MNVPTDKEGIWDHLRLMISTSATPTPFSQIVLKNLKNLENQNANRCLKIYYHFSMSEL